MVVSLRMLLKNKFFSTINIVGLAVAMAVFMLIAQYVKFESSYESFVPGAELIYRVRLETYLNNELVTSTAENYPGVGPALRGLPEVIDYARLYNLGYKNNVVITNEEAMPQPIAIKQRRFLYADSSFLPMMGYKLETSNVATALADANTAVITREYANMYFGDDNPVGKTLRMRDDDNNNELVTVTGVVHDAPANTHLKFDILFSYKTLLARKGKRPDYAFVRFEGWQRNDMYTYIRVRPGTDPSALEAKFPAIVDANKPKSSNHQKDILHVQALSSIHLTSHLAEEMESNGDERIVSYLGLVGMFVLIIGWINYVNLSTAKAMERGKEVGVRKVMGAIRLQLIQQFLTEAGIVNFLSLVIAFAMTGVMLPAFNSISGLALDAKSLVEPWFLALVGLLWIMGTLLSGFYPAMVLSSFKAVFVLKGKLRNSSGGILLRKSLVVFQFMASVALISGTLIVYDQLSYMMSNDIGMNIDQVLVLHRPGIEPPRTGTKSMNVFRNELKKNLAIKSVTGSSTIPGMQREYKSAIKKFGAPDDQQVTVRLNSMDFEFMDVFKMKVLAGRVFSEAYPHDVDTAVVITESTSKILGFKDPEGAVGQTLTLPDWGWNPVIVGVVNDYHQMSFKQALEPTLFYCDPFEGEFYSLRISTDRLPETIDHIRASWQNTFPGNPFDYFFLDEYFNQQYKNERQFGQLFSTFAALALMIGCLGLFGLSAYTAMQRTKEIGIRKVLGSSEGSLFILLSKDYIKLILLAIALGVPMVYVAMNDWLQSFAYRVTISSIVFISSGVAVLLISLLTVSFQTIRASRANPVDSLRYE